MQKGIKNIFFGYDRLLFASVIALVAIGLLSLFSTTQPDLVNFYRQILWLALGITIALILGSIDYRVFRVHFAPVLFLYVLGFIGIIAVFFFGVTVFGARRWLSFGFFHVEPVELLKVILVLILAKYFSMRHVEMYRFKHVIVSGIYVLAPSLFILIQPDLGSFIILVFIWIAMMVVAGIKFKHMAVLAIAGIIIAVFAWSFVLEPFQQARILSFMDPDADPLGTGYHTIQATIAVGSGGLWGKGLGQGTQSQLGFLPEVHTDFIFASLVEEFGVAMILVMLTAYGVFFWRMMRIARLSSNNFARLTIAGFSIMIIVQLFINAAMNLGITPITGVTLPFISYGGSSLIALFSAVGIAQSIHRHSIVDSIDEGTVKDV